LNSGGEPYVIGCSRTSRAAAAPFPAALRDSFSLSSSFACDRQGRGGNMTFTIHASKDGHMTQTPRIDPEVAVAKARALLDRGWEMHITDQAGRRYRPEAFDRLCSSGSKDSVLSFY
jgi:hypothetical protein